MSGTMTLLEWLTEVKLAKFHDAIVDMGCEELQFLLDMEDEDIAGMCSRPPPRAHRRSPGSQSPTPTPKCDLAAHTTPARRTLRRRR